MYDQLIIGDKGSFDDFGFSVASRKIGQPKKKTVKETVPYSNKTYDFSAINGELYWEERSIEYVFEMTAQTPEKLEENKTAFANWIMQVMDADIHDPFIEDYHFYGSFDDMDFEDDEGLDKTTATVTFAVYPYKIANLPKRYSFKVPANSNLTYSVYNQSNHRIVPTITLEAELIIKFGTKSLAVSAGKITDDMLTLEIGNNNFEFQNAKGSDASVLIEFQEEVL